ncbi:MAG TPA: rRNA maturation RNase YbeY [Candidatus Paceibacterota bacterium]|nr:rRNA maturation RNase YbeY [Candidatus Paceibacterota bacterium]
MATLDIRNFTRGPVPRFAYEKAHALALPGWDISLVFAGETRARHLNKVLRKKDYVPNVLSYESGQRSGEIIICPAVARKEASAYGMSYTAFVGFLFIHGMLHLAGKRHGTTMERQERAILARLIDIPLTAHEATHRNRH